MAYDDNIISILSIGHAFEECDAWFQEWRTTDFMIADNASSALLQLADWPGKDAPAEKLLFAAILYDIDGKAELAATYYIDSVKKDAELLQSEHIQTIVELLRDAGLRFDYEKSSTVTDLTAVLRTNHVGKVLVSKSLPAQIARTLYLTDDDLSRGKELLLDCAVYVRNYVLRTNRYRKGTSPLVRAQKLLFYAEGVYIAECGCLLFKRPIVAKAKGPVYVDAQDKLNELATEKVGSSAPLPHNVLDEATKVLLDDVLAFLGNLDVSEIVDKGHEELPWIVARDDTNSQMISTGLMLEWFTCASGQAVIRPILEHRRDRSEDSKGKPSKRLRSDKGSVCESAADVA